MGVGGKQPQGLWITTRDVHYDAGAHDLTRISEVGVITQFGYSTFAASAPVIRQFGLKIGILFEQGAQVGKPGNPNNSIEFTAAATGANLATLTWIVLQQDATVTNQVSQVFTGNNAKGYKILGQQIPDNTAGSNPWTNAQDRLFFRIVVRNFGPKHVKDVHVVPMVCTLASIPDFQQHYVLGVGAFSVGHSANGLEFDSQIVTRDVGSHPMLAARRATGSTRAASKARRPSATRSRPARQKKTKRRR